MGGSFITRILSTIHRRSFLPNSFNIEIAAQLSSEDLRTMESYQQNTRFIHIEFNKILTSRLKICNEDLEENFDLEFNQYYYKDFIYIKQKYNNKVCMRVTNKDTWMSLCKKNIIVLRPTINLLVSLQTLQLCCNSLTFLPEEICELKNLSRLIIAKNKIERLPTNIGLLRNLRELNAAGNMLKSLPHSFTSLRQLTFLILNDNRIEDLSHELSGCVSLKYLFIARNRVRSFGAELMLLPFLRIIDYQSNPLENEELPSKKEKILSLAEICARKIINCKTRIPKEMTDYIKKHLIEVKECFFCGGAFFNSCYEVSLTRVINDTPVPFKARLCKHHFKDQAEYVSKLFYLRDHRIGFHLCNDNYPRISELFVLTSYLPEKLKEMKDYESKKDSREDTPLFTLIEGYNMVDKSYIQYADKLLKITYKDEYRYSEQV